MSVEGAASRLGLTEYELRELVSGTAHSGVAERLGVSIKDMDDFFDGYVSPGMAEAWRDKVMSTPTRRKKPPSAHYVASLIDGLSGLWNVTAGHGRREVARSDERTGENE